MENHATNLPLVKKQRINGGAIEPDLAFPPTRNRKGVEVREILGPRDYSMARSRASSATRSGSRT